MRKGVKQQVNQLKNTLTQSAKDEPVSYLQK
uniref:Uncharacterized protein n=1 Tax=viral metagenome TaxID=1070528 RepID=A0A6C0DPH7_9ZZZZ